MFLVVSKQTYNNLMWKYKMLQKELAEYRIAMDKMKSELRWEKDKLLKKEARDGK